MYTDGAKLCHYAHFLFQRYITKWIWPSGVFGLLLGKLKINKNYNPVLLGMSEKRGNFQNMRTITWQNMRQKYAEIGRDYIFFVNLTTYIFDRIAVI